MTSSWWVFCRRCHALWAAADGPYSIESGEWAHIVPIIAPDLQLRIEELEDRAEASEDAQELQARLEELQRANAALEERWG